MRATNVLDFVGVMAGVLLVGIVVGFSIAAYSDDRAARRRCSPAGRPRLRRARAPRALRALRRLHPAALVSGRLRAVGVGGLVVSPVYVVGWFVARPPVWGLALQAAWAAVCVVLVLMPWRWRRRETPASRYQSAIVNSHPVAYWPLNEAQPRRRRWWRR